MIDIYWGESASLISAAYKKQSDLHAPEEFAFYRVVCKGDVASGCLYAVSTSLPNQEHPVLYVILKIPGSAQLVAGIDLDGSAFIPSFEDPNLRWYGGLSSQSPDTSLSGNKFLQPELLKGLLRESGERMLQLSNLLFSSGLQLADLEAWLRDCGFKKRMAIAVRISVLF